MHGFSMHQPASRPWDGRPALPASKPVVKKEDASRSDQTELVVCLERRGEGWGEEILPHLHVERRPVSPAAKHWPVQSKEEDTPGALEESLLSFGVPLAEVTRCVRVAVAWRVTPNGRPLVDRRRYSRLRRNVQIVSDYLQSSCHIAPGPEGVGAVFSRFPLVMLCKPTTGDRWDRRAVELAAFIYTHGHCQVPLRYEASPDLGPWVRRQRLLRCTNQLSHDRLLLLQSLGFEFGEVAQLTEEWEVHFDQLFELILWHRGQQRPFPWLGLGWSCFGGSQGLELARWLILQREYHRRRILPQSALQRFEILNIQWHPTSTSHPDYVWLSKFGQLLYHIEHQRMSQGVVTSPGALPKGLDQPKLGRPPKARPGEEAGRARRAYPGASPAPPYPASHPGSHSPHPATPLPTPPSASWTSHMTARRLAASDAVLDPGLGFWLSRQRWLWARGRLDRARAELLHVSGVDLDVGGAMSSRDWQQAAVDAAAFLGTADIALPGGAERWASVASPGLRQEGKEGPLAGPSQAWTGSTRAAPGAGRSAQGGSRRMAVVRWARSVLAAHREGVLSPAQRRFLAFLDLSWVLEAGEARAEGEAEDAALQAWRGRLAAAARGLTPSREARLWLRRQRALGTLGLLPPAQAALLRGLGVGEGEGRSAEDLEWDAMLSRWLVLSSWTTPLRASELPSVDPQLAAWVDLQVHPDTQLPKEKLAQLEAIGLGRGCRPAAARRPLKQLA
ncbi:hypothetical protein APUTEX25_000105 [Auxenochlorella protothecoides]|uniref:Helicase-associated domain-containing protein n=1 Tax=Auxenochlorella protothecoides TaxID=3075 RepID=A0A3M7L1X8_AUXPR|nr:hypothetical protein APUTEX25_000105 [Auxenochlorella protothecoides]|eukprot:RMZ55522.1 hypothetical protein APUTEX25_000105 [Auxenochlorella protothecoides]